MITSIQHLPYVKTIHFDNEVHAYLEPGIKLIGADKVWETFGTQGEGIRIGIIDSGIDYLHPALGGGIGPGFKVAGGYDFVNNDTDPMDDNGHGTHVAGIVSADLDSIKGVAPKAILYAYKVLNNNGIGLESDIISAIEFVVDPNQDGDTSDKMDIVNLSLGSDNGSPTDASSIAVNNATLAGVVFCVAAGNKGGYTPVQGKENNFFFDGSGTIGSPGSAELAITVGASDISDELPRFSSKGPNRVSFSIKPDVVAPGVEVNSTYLSGEYKVLSGTSMSTPMVSGVAALVKSLHPDWEPAFIKSAIVNSAKDIGLSVFLQGGGRIEALKSVNAKTLIVPATLSYGLDDPSLTSWIKPDTLLIYNEHEEKQVYTITQNNIIPGITFNFSQTSFSIPPNDHVPIIITISVDNNHIVNAEEDILRYTGSISFNGSIDTSRVPWGFVRTNLLVIKTSEPNAVFVGYSNASAIFSYDPKVNWTSPTRAEIYAPLKGSYSIVTSFRNPAGKSKIIIDDSVQINNDAAEIFLDASKAIYPLVYHGVDHQGNLLSSYRMPQNSIITTLPGFGDLINTFIGGSDTLLLSAMPDKYSFKPIQFQVDLMNEKTFHIVQFEKFNGMNKERIFTNSASDFILQHFKIKVPPATLRAANIIQFYSYKNGGLLSGLGYDIDTVDITQNEFSYTGYFGKSSVPQEDIATKFYTSYSNLQNLSLDYDSPLIMPYQDSIIASDKNFVSPAIPRFESGATMTFGGSPVHLFIIWYNNVFGNNSLHFRTLFRGMLNEVRNIDELYGKYTLFDKNGVELFTKSLADQRQPLELTADWYKMVVTSENYWLGNSKSSISLSSDFNPGITPAIPPSVTSFMLLDKNGHTTDRFVKDEPAVFQFSFKHA